MMVGCLEIMEYIFMLLVVIHQARRLWHAICMCCSLCLLLSVKTTSRHTSSSPEVPRPLTALDSTYPRMVCGSEPWTC